MFVIYATPFFNENTNRFLDALTRIPEVELGVISQDPQESVPEHIRERFAGHWRVYDSLQPQQLEWAARELQNRHGRIERLLAANEHIQVPVAQVREALGIVGMDVATVTRFRDKDQMKEAFRKAGVPCARSAAAHTAKEAWAFLDEVGYPVCVKPIDGAATQSTFRVEDAESMRDVLRACGLSQTRPLQIEEFVVGKEHSFETVSLGGKAIWHSLSRYEPTPLDAMRNPWIQYCVILPREVDSKAYDDIRKVGVKALKALGQPDGLSHMEWFRRGDGSIAINEVAARPPGVNLVPLINRSCDFDMFDAWCRLMIFDQFTPPRERKYAAGTAFLRGLGDGRVKAVYGLNEVLHDLGGLVTDFKAPYLGQPKAISYEGEGWVIVRHPETAVVEKALLHIVSNVRVELMN